MLKDGRGKLSPESRAKRDAGRDAYWAKRRAEKALQKELSPLSPHIENSFNGPAKDPLSPEVAEKTDKKLTSRERTQRRVEKKLEKLLDAQIDLATGLYYVTADGKHVYRNKPDGARGEYLLNQVIGKPKESIEVKSTTLNLNL